MYNVMLTCCPYYLLRDFTALSKLCGVINTQASAIYQLHLWQKEKTVKYTVYIRLHPPATSGPQACGTSQILKAAGPKNIPGWLVILLTSIFNLSLSQSTIQTFYKSSTISPPAWESMNDYMLVALTAIIRTCLESDTGLPLDQHAGNMTTTLNLNIGFSNK